MAEEVDKKLAAAPGDDDNEGYGQEKPEDPEEQFDPEVIAALKSMNDKVGSRILVPRRLQTKDAWKQRLFYRGHQRIADGGDRGWSLPGDGVIASGIGSN